MLPGAVGGAVSKYLPEIKNNLNQKTKSSKVKSVQYKN